MRDGFFHADMHPGNLFVDDEGRLVAVDFGIMGRLGHKERRFLAEILHGFITRDYRRTAEVHFEAGYVPPHHSVEAFAQAIRAIGEPIHNRTAEDISMAKLLTLLFEVTGLFDMRTRPGTAAAAEDDGGGRGRRAHARSQTRHVDDVRAGGARLDRRAISVRPAASRTPPTARSRSAVSRRGAGAADPRRAACRSARRRDPRRHRAGAGDGRGDRQGRGAAQPLDHRWRCG